MEPEIFSSLKKEAMEERYLDGTNRRLLQGLNLEFSTPAGVFDNIFLQATLVRLRKTANLMDRISYDFDPQKDRFSVAGRMGAEAYGASLGVNGVYTFNRPKSSLKNKALAANNVADVIVDYEENKVLSFDLGYNGKKLLSGPVNFGVGLEYALSGWKHSQDEFKTREKEILVLSGTNPLIPSNTPSGALTQQGAVVGNYYLDYAYTTERDYEFSSIESQSYKSAILANAFVTFNQNSFEAKLSGNFLSTDKNFESELAASPAYLPNLPILNSDANLNSSLEYFRTGSLENMYYSLYYSLPMNAITIVTGTKGMPSAIIGTQEMLNSGNLYNNYKFSQYYRNAYTQRTYTRLERGAMCSATLDHAVNLALPCGYATPDRKGGDADLSFAWNKAINVRAVFGKYSAETANYTRLGGGLEVNVARLAGLSKAAVISGSYEQNKEEEGLWNPQVDRIMAGFKVGIWRGLSLIGGMQQLVKEFKNPYVIAEDPEVGVISVNKIGEVLAIGGPQIKISERAEFSLQGGLLSNSIEGNNGIKLDLDKFIMSGSVTVEF
jgi:hypothetical protein